MHKVLGLHDTVGSVTLGLEGIPRGCAVLSLIYVKHELPLAPRDALLGYLVIWLLAAAGGAGTVER
jgi:hypothetical protein